jgi:hypothetical protein
MKKFNFDVSYVEINRVTLEAAQFGAIPFSTIANTYEEGRTKALEFAQSIARCYNSNRESAFYFRVCRK